MDCHFTQPNLQRIKVQYSTITRGAQYNYNGAPSR